jgi:hypothetical protein
MESTEVSQTEFRTTQIRFLPTHIEFVRNRFVYKKLPYVEIDELELQSGFLIQNRWIIRFLALVVIYLLIRYVLYGMDHTQNFKDTNPAVWFNKGSIFLVWGPVMLMIAMIAAIYQSFLRSTVITIRASNFKKSTSIRKMDKQGETRRLIPFLNSKDVLVFDKRGIGD